MARGRFITFEGPEGGGKTTQAKCLIERLDARGLDVVYAREPGGTPTGEAIRDILQHNVTGENISPPAEVLLFAASRAQLVAHVIRPALDRGAWVVCDRFADSTTAYQGYGRGFDVEHMIAINHFAIQGTEPDITFLLDVDLNEGFRRITARHQEKASPLDRIEREARTFHERVRAGYHALAARWPDRFYTVNGMDEESAVARVVWERVERAFFT
jgi:dTMP kinase